MISSLLPRLLFRKRGAVLHSIYAHGENPICASVVHANAFGLRRMTVRNRLNRRDFARFAGAAACSYSLRTSSFAQQDRANIATLFDGKNLDGWLQIENNATSLSSTQIANPAAFVNRIATARDPISAFLRSQLQDSVQTSLATYSPSSPDAKGTVSVIKDLNRILSGPSIYDKSRFNAVVLRPETMQLMQQNPRGYQLARLNKLLLEDAYPAELTKAPSAGWQVKNGVIASIGVGRGVIYTVQDFSHYRLMFTIRHVSGNPDHQACILIFCTRPNTEEKPFDVLATAQHTQSVSQPPSCAGLLS